jgi:post-segregation antitoxin (ccd killing protein)
MKRRAGKTATFSISVDSETKRILKQEARRSYDGNVSALVSAIAKEANRQSALDWLLQRSGNTPMTDAERDALLAEIDDCSASR